jgi:hypothetical protein
MFILAQGEAIEQSQTTTRKAHKNLDKLLCRLSRARKKCILMEFKGEYDDSPVDFG